MSMAEAHLHAAIADERDTRATLLPRSRTSCHGISAISKRFTILPKTRSPEASCARIFRADTLVACPTDILTPRWMVQKVNHQRVMLLVSASYMSLPSCPTQLAPEPLRSSTLSPAQFPSWIFFEPRRLRSCGGSLYVLPLRMGNACDVPGSCGSKDDHGSVGCREATRKER